MAKKSSKSVSKKGHRKGTRLETYAKRKQALAAIHDFSFKTRKNFTPAQKAAITRQWKKHQGTLEMLAAGKGVFKKAKKSQLRNLKTEDFLTTNKGVFIHAGATRMDKTAPTNVKIRGKGKKTRLEIITNRRREVFVQPKPGENFIKFTRRIIKEMKPHQLMLGVGPYKGLNRYDERTMLNYLVDDGGVGDIIKARNPKGSGTHVPFTGLYLVYWR